MQQLGHRQLYHLPRAQVVRLLSSPTRPNATECDRMRVDTSELARVRSNVAERFRMRLRLIPTWPNVTEGARACPDVSECAGPRGAPELLHGPQLRERRPLRHLAEQLQLDAELEVSLPHLRDSPRMQTRPGSAGLLRWR
eukprot:1184425-Prorocentrum_minimum.AAC.2